MKLYCPGNACRGSQKAKASCAANAFLIGILRQALMFPSSVGVLKRIFLMCTGSIKTLLMCFLITEVYANQLLEMGGVT